LISKLDANLECHLKIRLVLVALVALVTLVALMGTTPHVFVCDLRLSRQSSFIMKPCGSSQTRLPFAVTFRLIKGDGNHHYNTQRVIRITGELFLPCTKLTIA